LEKVTKDEAKRRILVTLTADHQRPESSAGVKFIPISHDSTQLEDDKSIVYLSFRVEDTGRGIKQADLDNLFQRFQQGSRRTHIKYGGSGLGLFICKELAKLQGGQIGVSAARGKGSTFAFYVRATHCSPPAMKDLRRGSHHTLSAPQAAASATEKKRIQHVLLVEDNLGEYRAHVTPTYRMKVLVSFRTNALLSQSIKRSWPSSYEQQATASQSPITAKKLSTMSLPHISAFPTAARSWI
jgi:hypothetical protein